MSSSIDNNRVQQFATHNLAMLCQMIDKVKYRHTEDVLELT